MSILEKQKDTYLTNRDWVSVGYSFYVITNNKDLAYNLFWYRWHWRIEGIEKLKDVWYNRLLHNNIYSDIWTSMFIKVWILW